MVFFELRWNYSPLKEKAVLLPDGLFVLLVRCRDEPLESGTALRMEIARDALARTPTLPIIASQFAN